MTQKASPNKQPILQKEKLNKLRNSKFKLKDWVHYTKKYKGVDFKQRVGEIFPSKYAASDLEKMEKGSPSTNNKRHSVINNIRSQH